MNQRSSCECDGYKHSIRNGDIGESDEPIRESIEKDRRTVSVSVETVVVIVFVDTVVGLVTCDAVTLVDAVRDGGFGWQKEHWKSYVDVMVATVAVVVVVATVDVMVDVVEATTVLVAVGIGYLDEQ